MEIVTVKTQNGSTRLFRFPDRQAADCFASVMDENGYEYSISTEPENEGG